MTKSFRVQSRPREGQFTFVSLPKHNKRRRACSASGACVLGEYLVPAAVHDGEERLRGSLRAVQPDPTSDLVDHLHVGTVLKRGPALRVDLPHHHTCTQTHMNPSMVHTRLLQGGERFLADERLVT